MTGNEEDIITWCEHGAEKKCKHVLKLEHRNKELFKLIKKINLDIHGDGIEAETLDNIDDILLNKYKEQNNICRHNQNVNNYCKAYDNGVCEIDNCKCVEEEYERERI